MKSEYDRIFVLVMRMDHSILKKLEMNMDMKHHRMSLVKNLTPLCLSVSDVHSLPVDHLAKLPGYLCGTITLGLVLNPAL